MNNISKISFKSNGNISTGSNHPEIKEAQRQYENFVQKMDKSDFCNTDRRYIAELTYIRRLKELYSEHNNTDLLREMEEKEQVILQKLKDEFHITFED